MSRNYRLLFVAIGAFAVAAALDLTGATAITMVAMSGPDTAPPDCAEIACQVFTDDFAGALSVFAWILVFVALAIGAVFIALVTLAVGGLSKWQARGASGTLLAIVLGIAAAALGPAIVVGLWD